MRLVNNNKGIISIHTPARGVTLEVVHSKTKTTKISIHTPARGVTRLDSAARMNILISIHTPARGVTL